MRALHRILITLPIVAAPWLVVAGGQAKAATVSHTQAIELLARAKAIDGKCSRLSSGERQELSDYLAKAEVAVAQRTSVEEVQMAIASGRASGEGSLCDPASVTEVSDTLSAARQAMAAVEMRASIGDQQATRRSERWQPASTATRIAEPLPKPKAAPARVALAVPAAPAPAFSPGLNRYAGQAMAYYVERRCKYLSHGDAIAFWKMIIVRHRAVLSANSKAQVATALRAAEARAQGQGCGSQSASLVRSAYAEIRGP